MTDELRRLLSAEAASLDVPPVPHDTLTTGGRRIRRRRQAALTSLVAACVLAAGAGVFAVAGPGDESVRPVRPGAPSLSTADPTSDATGARPLEASGTGVAGQAFGAPRADVVAAVTSQLGTPDTVVGPLSYVKLPGEDGYFQDHDNLSPHWRFPAMSVTCWSTLCLIFGGTGVDDLRLRGWELSEFRRFVASEEGLPEPRPDVRLAGTAIGLGSSWAEVRSAYPSVTLGAGEGNSLVLADLPWQAIFDGVGQWRLSGYYDREHPGRAQTDSVVTRLSGGEAPQPGCC